MANFETMIPFILHFAAGVSGKDLRLPLVEQFEIARRKGWSDDPDDPGGATMIDVTLTTYRDYIRKQRQQSVGTRRAAWRETSKTVCQKPSKTNLKQITFNEWKEILKTMYWDRWRADEITSPGLAHLLVDWIWASGPKTIKNAQRIIGTEPDGTAGPKTLATINRTCSIEPKGKIVYYDTHALLFDRLRDAREKYYRSCPASWKYLNGWLRRLNAIQPDGTFKLT